MKYIKSFQKILKILTIKERHQVIRLFIWIIIGTLIETFSLALFVPLIKLLVQGDYVEKFPEIVLWLEKIGNPNQITLIMFSLLFLIMIYIIKNLFLFFLAWEKSQFSTKTLANLSSRLFNLYLYQPYTFHLQNNSALLIRNTIDEVNKFGGNTLQPSLDLTTELFVLIGILALLLYVEPIGTISAASIIGIIGGTFHFFTKGKILRWGKEGQYHGGMKIKQLQQGFGGAKVVKLIGCEDYFWEQYRFHALELAHIRHRKTIITQMPRFLFEIMAISGLATVIIVIMLKDNSTEGIMPVLGLFAIASFRLIPSINKILSSIQSLQYGSATTSLIYKEITSLQQANNIEDIDSVNIQKVLELKGISFIYPNADKKSLQNITMNIKKGETIGLIGESGSGKSTVSDIILGLLKPSSGKILVDGVDIYQNIRGWQKNIGYVPQSIYLTDDTLRRNIAFGLKDNEIDDEKVWRVLKMAQLDDFINKLPKGLDTSMGERGVRLSGGQQQRIGIARALYHDPSILLLDEATSALDNTMEAKFMEVIENLYDDKTVIIIAHRLSTVQNCDRIYRLKEGFIISTGTPEEILYNKK